MWLKSMKHPAFFNHFHTPQMSSSAYPRRKHLTIIEKNGRTYFKVQFNKTKIGLKVNKTFSKYEDAIELIQACENKYGVVTVKGLVDTESEQFKALEQFMLDPPIDTYLSKYIDRYIDPKYAHLDGRKPEDKYKLRQKQSTLGMLDICLNTKINHEVESEFKVSKAHWNETVRTTIGMLRPSELKTSDINSLIIVLKAKGMKPISISTYLSRASVFWKKLPSFNSDLENLPNPWLMYDKDILTNGNKIFRKKPFRFNHDILKRLARAIKGKNIRPVIHLMYKLGLRRQEAVLLTKEQIFEKPTPHIYIQSKNTERIVYLNDRQYRFIKSLMRKDSDRLFDYEVLGFDGSYTKAMESANLNIKQHDYRKDYISRMIEQVGISNSILLSQLLGHSTPRAIERMRNTFPERKAQFSDQSEILKQIGHRNSRITAEHYYSMK